MGIVHEGDFSFGLKSVIHCACRSCRCQCKSSTTGLLQPCCALLSKAITYMAGEEPKTVFMWAPSANMCWWQQQDQC
jgi:hypothetical protein